MDGMNQGNGSDLRGRLHDHWQRLDDSDLSRIERDRTSLAGILQQRYGLTREAAEQQSVAFLHAAAAESRSQSAPQRSSDSNPQRQGSQAPQREASRSAETGAGASSRNPWENPKPVPAGQLVAGGAPGDAQRVSAQSVGGGSVSPGRGGSTPSGNPQAGNASRSSSASTPGSGSDSQRGSFGSAGSPGATGGNGQQKSSRSGSSPGGSQVTGAPGAPGGARPGSDADEDVSEKRKTGETRATPAGGEVDGGGDKNDQEARGGGRSADADE